MAGWKRLAAYGMVVASSAFALGSDCDVLIDDDGISIDTDDDDDFSDWWDNLFDD